MKEIMNKNNTDCIKIVLLKKKKRKSLNNCQGNYA